MKKKILLLFIFAIGMVFFTSCEKELASLEGTSWKDYITNHTEGGVACELIFTSSEATYTRTSSDGRILETLSGIYTFNYPKITLTMGNWGMDGETYTYTSIGTVKGKAMKIEIITGDIIWNLELKKQ